LTYEEIAKGVNKNIKVKNILPAEPARQWSQG
jgi:hypothetical protein